MADEAETQLKSDEIVQALVGHKIDGLPPKGEHWTGICNADGTATYGDGSTGRLHVEDALFCDQPAGGKEACRLVMKLGENKYQMMREDDTKSSLVATQ